MKIWKLETNSNNYKTLQFKEKTELHDFTENMVGEKRNKFFRGCTMKDIWINPTLYCTGKEQLGDVIDFAGGIIGINEKALTILEPFLKNKIELLPIVCKHTYYIINVLNILDCIDYEKSEYDCFSNSNRIMSFDKYVFNEELIKNEDFFNIKDEPRGFSFVSEKFVQTVLENDLKGFYFNLAYETGKDVRFDLRYDLRLKEFPPILT